MANLKYPHRCEILVCTRKGKIKVCCCFCEEKDCIEKCKNSPKRCKQYYMIGGNENDQKRAEPV